MIKLTARLSALYINFSLTLRELFNSACTESGTMSDYEAYAERHQKLEEIREKYFKKDEEEDDVDYFQKKRIER